jgi:flagellar biosynthesis/type III secretory pathway protein FliH
VTVADLDPTTIGGAPSRIARAASLPQQRTTAPAAPAATRVAHLPLPEQTEPAPTVGPPSRLLKAGTVRSIDAAQQYAAAARAESDAELDRVRQAGFDAGWDAAQADARRRGLLAAESAGAALQALVATVRSQGTAVATAEREDVLACALEIATWVVQAELADPGRVLLSRLRAALGTLDPGAGTATVTVGPADADAVRAAAADPVTGFAGAVTVVVDPRLGPGEARLLAGGAHSDLGIADALARAAAALGLAGGSAA